jgi:hypothetical protein
LEPALFDPAADLFGGGLRPVVGADKLRRTVLLHRFVQYGDDIARLQAAIDFQGEALLGELIDQRQPFQTTPVAGLVENKVVAPNVVAALSLEPAGAVLSAAQAATLAHLVGNVQSGLLPKPVHAFEVHRPAFLPQLADHHAVGPSAVRHGPSVGWPPEPAHLTRRDGAVSVG